VTPRLTAETLKQLRPEVSRPAYDRAAHGVGVVHLGVGAFHRAHQAAYFDELLAQIGGNWRILGVSCRSGEARDRLRSQDYLYTLSERSSKSERQRIIGSLAGVLVAAEDPGAVITALARPATHLISLTITEKGYCRDALSGGLDLRHPDIVHDLEQIEKPRSAPGLLLQGLRRRRELGIPAPTLLSCDNLPLNGRLLKRILIELAEAADPESADWIERFVHCPCTVVDRIVPATTAADIEAAAASTAVRDDALVKTEPFSQWVIEDDFAGPRPRLDLAGAQLVSDVRPCELAKLRLLNGSHSALAYLGSLAGFSFIHEAIAQPEFLALIKHLMQREVAPTLGGENGIDLHGYQSTLLARFANSALKHQLEQIAADGSQKLPQRLLDPLLLRLKDGRPSDALILASAGWMRYVLGWDERGRRYPIEDPLAEKFTLISKAASREPLELVDRFLQLSEIFGKELPEHLGFRTQLVRALTMLLREGAQATVRSLVRQLGL
jgi:fructuronate reductase